MNRRQRPRRLRASAAMRRSVSETRLSVDDLIYPMFVTSAAAGAEPIASMPGVFRYGQADLLERAREAAAAGVGAIILFGVGEPKDPTGSHGWSADGAVPRAVRAIVAADLGLLVITDVCLCTTTDHGHCGVLDGEEIVNDASVELLVKIAVAHAEAGADVVAPSDMMDHRVGAIRDGLDGAGFERVAIMSYAVKYASAYYGPFRDAADSAPAFGDRRSHQMDPANAREALREARLDIEEGADMVMVKPALAYLDIVRLVREAVDVPVAAYAVSGEYAMIEAAAQNGWIERRAVVLETLLSMRRAGADLILTYHAVDAARWLADPQG
jgi:porphobilinogen synthase